MSAASKSRTDKKSLRVWVAGVTGVVSFVTFESLVSPLGAVVRVDANVFGAQIARPHGRRSAAGAEVDADGQLGALQVLGGRRRELVVRLAVLEQDEGSHGDAGPRRV